MSPAWSPIVRSRETIVSCSFSGSTDHFKIVALGIISGQDEPQCLTCSEQNDLVLQGEI